MGTSGLRLLSGGESLRLCIYAVACRSRHLSPPHTLGEDGVRNAEVLSMLKQWFAEICSKGCVRCSIMHVRFYA